MSQESAWGILIYDAQTLAFFTSLHFAEVCKVGARLDKIDIWHAFLVSEGDKNVWKLGHEMAKIALLTKVILYKLSSELFLFLKTYQTVGLT